MKKDTPPTTPPQSPETPSKPSLSLPVQAERLAHAQMAESLQHLLTAPKKLGEAAPLPPDIAPLAAHLTALTNDTQAALDAGTRMPLEDHLVQQARMLDAVFHTLIHRMAQFSLHDDTLRTALNTQRQYRYTVETLRKAPQKNTANELNRLELAKIDRLVIDHVSNPE